MVLEGYKKIIENYNGKILLRSYALLDQKYKNFLKDLAATSNNVYFNGEISDIDSNDKLKLDDGHPNKEGRKQIASDIFNYLVENKIINCN